MIVTSVQDAVDAFARGEVVAVPTDTVYGFVCSPFDAGAIEEIYRLKARPKALELTLLAPSAKSIEDWIVWTPEAQHLAAAFWPGALSIISEVARPPEGMLLPLAGHTLSVRVPALEWLLQFLARVGPVASTSANRHGEAVPPTAEAIEALMGGHGATVVRGMPGEGRASTIIDCAAKRPTLVREGPIPWDTISSVARGPLGHREAEK